MSFEGLMGKLKAFEVQLKMMSLEPKKDEKVETKVVKVEKNIAFKSSKLHYEDNNDFDPEEIAMITRNFNKFLKNNFRKTGNAWENAKYNKEGGDSSVPRCFKCNEKGHLKADCPTSKDSKGKELEKGKHSFNKGMLATWDDDDVEELHSSDDNNDGFQE